MSRGHQVWPPGRLATSLNEIKSEIHAGLSLPRVSVDLHTRIAQQPGEEIGVFVFVYGGISRIDAHELLREFQVERYDHECSSGGPAIYLQGWTYTLSCHFAFCRPSGCAMVDA